MRSDVQGIARFPSLLGIVALLIPTCLFAQNLPVMTEILSRPTDRSVTVSILLDKQADVRVEFGTTRGGYDRASAVVSAQADVPVLVVLDSLTPDTRYYYRTCTKTSANGTFACGEVHAFHTRRAPGSTFSFTIEADPHPYDKKGSHTLWRIALENQRRDSADFLIDMGDTFGDDHEPTTITNEELRKLHLDCRPFFGAVCHSSPMFFCLGNHEGESGYYLLQSPPDNLGVRGTLWRKYYFPNPVPDGFYSGNTAQEGHGIGHPENYYAFTWGDALFVVLDAYRGYTASAKPRQWEWTFGREQYDWLKHTLETSTATYKFVFTHHTLGETRGGAATARLYEWGGYDGDGKTWGFDAQRPGWGAPIHQLMLRNNVQIFFQGHDHIFAKEDVDGIVYQAVPMPSDSTYVIGMRDNGDAYTGVTLDGSGHLRVTVGPAAVRVDFVRAWLPADETNGRRNGEVAHSYTVAAGTADAGRQLPVPAAPVLMQNHPNPFTFATVIRYELPEEGPVTLRVYDMLGKEVRMLVDARQTAGVHQAVLAAETLPPGMYWYQLRTSGALMARRALHVR